MGGPRDFLHDMRHFGACHLDEKDHGGHPTKKVEPVFLIGREVGRRRKMHYFCPFILRRFFLKAAFSRAAFAAVAWPI